MQKYPSKSHTDAPSQTNLGSAYHSHMDYWRQKLHQCLQQELAKRSCQRILRKNGKSIASTRIPTPLHLALKRLLVFISNNHLRQTPQGLRDKTSTLDPPQSSDNATQHSSSPNLICKVQDWRDWTYTDGCSKIHEEGHMIRCIPPLNRRIPLREPKRRRYNQNHVQSYQL